MWYVQNEHQGSEGYPDESKKQLGDWIDSSCVSFSVQVKRDWRKVSGQMMNRVG